MGFCWLLPQAQGGHPSRKRRVVTLERSKTEYSRPVNVTVQKLYFGDWTVENLPPDEGGSGDGSRRFGSGGRSGDRSGAYTRGASDRGAVRDLNGRPSSARSGGTRTGQPQAPQGDAGAGGADGHRRRRRRGRRGGSGTQS